MTARTATALTPSRAGLRESNAVGAPRAVALSFTGASLASQTGQLCCRPVGDLSGVLRCIDCGSPLESRDGARACTGCEATYPVVRGTVRMLPGDHPEPAVTRRTAESFAYEWEHFGGRRP